MCDNLTADYITSCNRLLSNTRFLSVTNVPNTGGSFVEYTIPTDGDLFIFQSIPSNNFPVYLPPAAQSFYCGQEGRTVTLLNTTLLTIQVLPNPSTTDTILGSPPPQTFDNYAAVVFVCISPTEWAPTFFD